MEAGGRGCEAAELGGAAPKARSRASASRAEGLWSAGRVWEGVSPSRRGGLRGLPRKLFQKLAMKTAISWPLEVYSRDNKILIEVNLFFSVAV